MNLRKVVGFIRSNSNHLILQHLMNSIVAQIYLFNDAEQENITWKIWVDR